MKASVRPCPTCISISSLHFCSRAQIFGCKMLIPLQFGRANVPLFSISFAALVLVIIYANSFIANVSLLLVASENIGNSQDSISRAAPHQWNSTLIHGQRLLVKAEIKQFRSTHKGNLVSLPPSNVTVRKRSSRFKRRLAELDMLKPVNLTRNFDGEVRKFLGGDCQLQFFMTWISPVNSFGAREFLAMESLFKAHPHGCLVVLSWTMDSSRGFGILKPLLDRGYRVRAITPDLSFLLTGTPAESWFNKIRGRKKDPGSIPLPQNLSNLLRLAVLYKYGGVYLDTDFIVLKDFSGLRNSIGAQSADASGNWTRLNNAILVFDKNHPLLYKFMKEFAVSFDGNVWGYNGPYLVSRVVKRVSKPSKFNFTVLQPTAFYPVDWTRICGYFIKPLGSSYSRWVEAELLQLGRKTYAVHLWNRHSSRLKIEEGSIVSKLVSDHCVICRPAFNS